MAVATASNRRRSITPVSPSPILPSAALRSSCASVAASFARTAARRRSFAVIFTSHLPERAGAGRSQKSFALGIEVDHADREPRHLHRGHVMPDQRTHDGEAFLLQKRCDAAIDDE